MIASNTSRQTRKGPPKFINTGMVLLLRSPLHGMVSKLLMLLTFKGSKSGKFYTIPVGYMRQGNTVELFTDRNWWKKLLDSAPVTLRIQGKKLQGTAEVISEQTDLIAEKLANFVRLHPGAARAYDVSLKPTGNPNQHQYSKQLNASSLSVFNWCRMFL